MILPTKHIMFSESLLGLGAVLISLLPVGAKVETLWDSFQKINQSDLLPAYHTFENFIAALDFLYLSGAIAYTSTGELIRETA
ncbi:MAG: ABC-three component system middle component 6 [Prosthecobacter sp.]